MDATSLGFGFLRIAGISPEVVVGDIRTTTDTIIELTEQHAKMGVKLITFSELCLAGGYTNGDLLHQDLLQKEALNGLARIVLASIKIDAMIVIGMPLLVRSTLYNVAVVVNHGTIRGIVPKTYLPNGGEFYESRWFGTADDLINQGVKEINLFGKQVPIGTDMLFASQEDDKVIVCIDMCEDGWTALPPSSFAAVAGATVILNLSASNEVVGKNLYRHDLVVQQSGRCIAGHLYVSAGPGESTTDLVFGGHCLVAENGSLLGETERYLEESHSLIADLDLDVCVHDRQRTTSFAKSARELRNRPPYRMIPVSLPTEVPVLNERLFRHNQPFPFVPTSKKEKAAVCADVFDNQVTGLIRRLKKTGFKKVALGLSGGLDSTLALLVCLKAFAKLGYDPKGIHAYTMPGFGTTKGTRSNAWELARATGITIEEISIVALTTQSLKDIGHSGKKDVTYENAQARARTFILMQKSNQIGAIVIGTGDLSEGGLGWCTFNGDHISHYNVNCGVPKTLVRFVVEWYTQNTATDRARTVLQKILDTPVSPELVPGAKGKIGQKTEDIIGPYALHDFFVRQFVRYGSTPQKIWYLATRAFIGTYTKEEVRKWLRKFIERFFANQFKRSVASDGPKIGSVSLSPRGDWRMPSEAVATQWLQDLERNVW